MRDTNKDWLLLLVTCVLMWHPKHHMCFTRQSSLSLSTFNHHFLQVRFEILLVSPQARGLKEGRTEVRHQSLFIFLSLGRGGSVIFLLLLPLYLQLIDSQFPSIPPLSSVGDVSYPHLYLKGNEDYNRWEKIILLAKKKTKQKQKKKETAMVQVAVIIKISGHTLSIIVALRIFPAFNPFAPRSHK